MQGCRFDEELTGALELLTEARWAEAQRVLQTRLARAAGGGHKRLNLFLLSIAAASSGQAELANTLWRQAQGAPLGDLTARYLDIQLTPNDPRQSVLLDLERAWWDFNGWNSSGPRTDHQTGPVPVDWDLAVDSCLSGDSPRLESLYGKSAANPEHECALLWNLLALSYLEAGNVRTYEEMASNAPAPPPANSLPDLLVVALRARGLERALESLNRGEWLNYTGLSRENLGEVERRAPVGEDQWVAQMENGFALIELNQLNEACRSFQEMASSAEQTDLRMLSLNALSLAFFKMGDYTQAETLFLEFENLKQNRTLASDEPYFRMFRKWLDSVDAGPSDGELFFTPFCLDSTARTGSSSPETIDFWETLGKALQDIESGNQLEAKRRLGLLESSSREEAEDWKLYLVVLAYLCGAVISGDHFEVQEFEQELASLQFTALFSSEQLREAKDLFRWVGFEQLGLFFDRFHSGRPAPLNPWQDLQLNAC